MYHCVATSAIGFIQQLAVAYVSTGHWFFVSGWVPEGKDPSLLDSKLIERYEIEGRRWERARRKRSGQASVHYLRFGRFFVLISTHGVHRFFDEEGKSIKDARRTPIRALGYAISYRGGHCHVRIDQAEYRRLKAFLEEQGTRRKREVLEAYLWALPFEPYAPVRRQLLTLWRGVNRIRQEAGFDKLDVKCVRTKRRIVKPFEHNRAVKLVVSKPFGVEGADFVRLLVDIENPEDSSQVEQAFEAMAKWCDENGYELPEERPVPLPTGKCWGFVVQAKKT